MDKDLNSIVSHIDEHTHQPMSDDTVIFKKSILLRDNPDEPVLKFYEAK